MFKHFESAVYTYESAHIGKFSRAGAPTTTVLPLRQGLVATPPE